MLKFLFGLALFFYLKDRAVLRYGGWRHMPATQHLGIEGKEDQMFKVTSNCTKSEVNLGY